jgi:hypothetical protein
MTRPRVNTLMAVIGYTVTFALLAWAVAGTVVAWEVVR